MTAMLLNCCAFSKGRREASHRYPSPPPQTLGTDQRSDPYKSHCLQYGKDHSKRGETANLWQRKDPCNLYPLGPELI